MHEHNQAEGRVLCAIYPWAASPILIESYGVLPLTHDANSKSKAGAILAAYASSQMALVFYARRYVP